MNKDRNFSEQLEAVRLEIDAAGSTSKQLLAELISEEICNALNDGFVGEIRIHPPHECGLYDQNEDCSCTDWAGFYSKFDYAPIGIIYLDIDSSIRVCVRNEFLGGNIHAVNSAGIYSLMQDDLGGPELGMETDNLTSNDNRYLLSYILAEELYWHVPDLTSDWVRLEVDRVGRNSQDSSFG